MAIKGEEGEYSLFVRHDYFRSSPGPLSNFRIFSSIYRKDGPLEKRRSLATTASPIAFAKGISQTGPELPEL
ncbi:MAG TPA: hypothetical protein VGF61_14505 [Candidatus Acidoferrum sp.]|jgi:hypothetical protein